MLILILSTPRSGSHYYSECVQEQHPNSIVMHEVLSRAYKDVYLKTIGELEYSNQYEDGYYYEDLQDDMLIRRYSPRPDKELFFNMMLKELEFSNKTYILHEQVSLLPDHWIEKLIKFASNSTYLKRENRKEQLASRLIAGYTSVYVVRPNYKLCHGDRSNIHLYDIEKFTESIATKKLVSALLTIYKDADNRMKDMETVVYESIPKKNNTHATKLFASSFDRLCEQDQNLINSLIDSN